MIVFVLNSVENIAAKGEIAHFEQFLLLSQCFQKSFVAEASESICMLLCVIPIITFNK